MCYILGVNDKFRFWLIFVGSYGKVWFITNKVKQKQPISKYLLISDPNVWPESTKIFLLLYFPLLPCYMQTT